MHYSDVIMGTMASQSTSLAIVYSPFFSGVDQRKHQSSGALAFVRGIHRWPVNPPHKWPVPQKMFPFDDVIMENDTYQSLLHRRAGDTRQCQEEEEVSRGCDISDDSLPVVVVEMLSQERSSTIIDQWGVVTESTLSLKTAICHDANFVVTGGTEALVPPVTSKLASRSLCVFWERSIPSIA